MKDSCILCGKEISSHTNDVFAVLSWVFTDILEKNRIQYNNDLPRIVMVCSNCWNSLKEKPQRNDYYWIAGSSIFERNNKDDVQMIVT